MSIYDFNVKDTEGNDVSLSEYEGKVLLIVNSATKCGFTPQYNELTEIYNKYKDQGFTILDFPCNQFGNQAPGTGEEIKEACRLNFLVEYPIFEKIDVNGENEDPLYTYLKQEQPFTEITGKGATKLKLALKVMNRNAKKDDIKWNFTKFLVDREGNVVRRFEPTEDLKDVEQAVMELL
ncbi:MAG: glutathione peroxidase [Methanosphaera stadtmanae]|uniref:Glutathione peroxidase n=1 Tax=Methanobrevibacter olleyae TaxID=294671 RepID=A0A8T3W0F4_METOL|nr:glutathione peroxidase [Methanosphaera stadtmanae]MBE6513439.1 glutathione peroxidase [Methanobrevibacter olleyae]